MHWYKYWWYNFYLFISVGCSMEYDCMWQDQANSRNDRTSQTLPELYATKITRFVIIFKVKNLSQDLYMTRWKSKNYGEETCKYFQRSWLIWRNLNLEFMSVNLLSKYHQWFLKYEYLHFTFRQFVNIMFLLVVTRNASMVCCF